MTNSLSGDPLFRQTFLYRTFAEKPLGFIDVGALGGIHPLVLPIASLVHALCFEPNDEDCLALHRQYSESNPFAGVTFLATALADEPSPNKKLYICEGPVNTSLLEPSETMVQRYRAENFKVSRIAAVPAQTLDSVVDQEGVKGKAFGEFLKLDTQGSEYEILKGADRVLRERTLGVWCEAEFFEVYRGEKRYAEIDRLLREYGLVIYGLYPHYLSTKALDRKKFHTEERLMWADAFFLKDPLDRLNRERHFSDREIQVLILIALLTRFYDFALELVFHFLGQHPERGMLESLIRKLAEVNQEILADEITTLRRSVGENPDQAYFLTRRFAAKHSSNTNLDYLKP